MCPPVFVKTIARFGFSCTSVNGKSEMGVRVTFDGSCTAGADIRRRDFSLQSGHALEVLKRDGVITHVIPNRQMVTLAEI